MSGFVLPQFGCGRFGHGRGGQLLPLYWPLRCIISVVPGRDGQVRCVTIRISGGTMNLPAIKLYSLFVEDSLSVVLHVSAMLVRRV